MKPKLLLSLTTNGHIYGGAFAGCGADVTVKHIPEITTDYDGLVLCGGDDIDPTYYGQENTACGKLEQERDKAEFALLDAFVRAGKPVLGICRGHQKPGSHNPDSVRGRRCGSSRNNPLCDPGCPPQD